VVGSFFFPLLSFSFLFFFLLDENGFGFRLLKSLFLFYSPFFSFLFRQTLYFLFDQEGMRTKKTKKGKKKMAILCIAG